MSDEPDNSKESSFTEAFTSAARDVFRKRPSDPDEPRVSFARRWAGFLSWLIIPAVIGGVGFALGDYVTQSTGERHDRHEAAERIKRDTYEAMRNRFILGACVGGGLGAIYVIRCLIRKEDP